MRRPDVRDLLETAAQDGVVRWGDYGPRWRNAGCHGGDGKGGGGAHEHPHIFLSVGGGTEEPWDVMIEPAGLLESSKKPWRRFRESGISFVASEDGSALFIPADLWAWIYQKGEWGSDGGGGEAFLTRVGSALDLERYGELLRTVGVSEGLWIEDAISTEAIEAVLGIWARAYCGVELTFEFDPEARLPEWLTLIEDVVEGVGEVVPCQGLDESREPLYGEVGERCWLGEAEYVNPDGRQVCERHRVVGAVARHA